LKTLSFIIKDFTGFRKAKKQCFKKPSPKKNGGIPFELYPAVFFRAAMKLFAIIVFAYNLLNTIPVY